MSLAGLHLNNINTILPTLVFAIGLTDAVHLMIDLRRNLACAKRRDAIAMTVRALTLPCFLTSITTAIGFGSLVLTQELALRQFGLAGAAGTLLNFVAVITVLPLLASTLLGHALRPAPAATERLPAWQTPLHMIERHATAIVVVAVLVAAAMVAACTRLRPDFLVTEALPAHLASVQGVETTDRTLGGAMAGYVVVQWPQGMPFASTEVIDAIDKVHTAIDDRPEFRAPFSVRNLLVASSARDQPLARNIGQLRHVPEVELRRLVRTDLRRLVVSFRIPDVGAAALTPAFARLEESLAEIERERPGWQLYLTGTLPVVSGNLWTMIGDLGRSLASSTVLLFVVIGVALGSWKLGLLSLLPNVLPLLATSTLLVVCGEPLRLVTVLTYSLCLGIAVDDSIHALVWFKRYCRDHPVPSAVRLTYQTAGAGIVTSTVVLVSGFSVMLLSQMPITRWFGLLCSVTMITALVAVLLVLPALLLCFWPRSSEPQDSEDRAEGSHQLISQM
jgi:predicted RND superfamily exporter protein